MSQKNEVLDDAMIMSLKDWRQALRTPPAYRVGNSTLRIQTQFVSVIAIAGLIVLIIMYLTTSSKQTKRLVSYGLNGDRFMPALDLKSYNQFTNQISHSSGNADEFYNSTYPLTAPITTPSGIVYKIGIISDLDKKSKSNLEPNTWLSYFLKGQLIWNPSLQTISVVWDKSEPAVLKSSIGESGRGMELSELVVFNGKLLSFDDRTGIVYEVEVNSVIPWLILTDGNGRTSKGFKSEWATVKEHRLYVGSMGKEWTTGSGEYVNDNPMWVKVVTPAGVTHHVDWHANYVALRKALAVEFPGYVIHESSVWSAVHQRWFFLPRRLSKVRYSDDTDEHMSTNVLITADDHFRNIQVIYIGEVVATHGFSSFKFVPGSDDSVIVAIKSEEDNGRTASYVMGFTIDGKILLPETKIADIKYEGIEFV